MESSVRGEALYRRLGERGGEELRGVLEGLQAGAYLCDGEGVITYFNKRAEEMWGRSPRVGVERYCGSYELYTAAGERVRHECCWMARAILEGTGFNGREIVVRRPDGKKMTVLAYANPIRDEAGKVVGGVNVLVDVSGKKRAGETAVLLVEDHLDTAKSTERLLRMAGYHVETAHTMAAAVEIFGRGEIDLVVSDIGLPDGTGCELLGKLRKMDGEVRAVALSGYGTEQDFCRSREAGFAEHIVKPVDWERLKGALERLMGEGEKSGASSQ